MHGKTNNRDFTKSYLNNVLFEKMTDTSGGLKWPIKHLGFCTLAGEEQLASWALLIWLLKREELVLKGNYSI